MGVLRRAEAANVLVGVLALVFPPLKYVPGALLCAALLVVGLLAAICRFWIGPRPLSTPEQRRWAANKAALTHVGKLDALVTSDGRLTYPTDRWADEMLADRSRWRKLRQALASVRVHDPDNRMADDVRARVMRFLEEHAGEPEAVQLALLIFRVGGPPPGLYAWADRITDPQAAGWLFDAFETRELLEDREYWPEHRRRGVQPWAPEFFGLCEAHAGDRVAMAVFGAPVEDSWRLRAAGDRPAGWWAECRLLGLGEDGQDVAPFLEGNREGSPEFGPAFYRANAVRSDYFGRPSLWRFRREPRRATYWLECPGVRLPAAGGVILP